jgi:hypothetical protein
MSDARCLIVYGVEQLGVVEQSIESPTHSLCARSDQSCCSLATTTWPGVAALRALIHKQ